jgi:hypothetical protein
MKASSFQVFERNYSILCHSLYCLIHSRDTFGRKPKEGGASSR